MWTDEEASYLKAVLHWQGPEDEKKSGEGDWHRGRQTEKKSAGEFRVLVIGAKGVGKTAILTRFGQNTFRGEGLPPDPFYERGCRRPLDLSDVDGLADSTLSYVVDALEMPSRHLASNPLLEQAIGITEAAVLVYDVRDRDSFRLATGVAMYVREITSGVGVGTVSKGSGSHPAFRREYGLLLVGNKKDAMASERVVSWAEGRKAALALAARGRSGRGGSGRGAEVASTLCESISAAFEGNDCGFFEVSAKTGENIDEIFALAGTEVLRLRRMNQERREELERAQRLRQDQMTPAVKLVKRRRASFWGSLRTVFVRQ